MELPRSRWSAHSPVDRKTESGLPYTAVIDEKKSRVPLLVTCLIVFALLGCLLHYNLVSLICEKQLDQPESESLETDPSIPTARKVEDNPNLSVTLEAKKEERVEADYTLGGLLAYIAEFEPGTCASRGHQPHRKINFKPSKELVQRLRKYEVRHRECTARAQSFLQSSHGIHYRGSEAHVGDCRYVVWIAFSGLGNRLMTLVSAFLYALLTNRTLLVDRGSDMSELFCEPIPKSSWFVPSEITVERLQEFNESSPFRFRHTITDDNDSLSTADVYYIHLTHSADDKDQEFFCDSGQEQLAAVPWLFLKTDAYLVPAYFLISQFESDLGELFPDKEAIFHLLGRYLFHPSNAVWAWITRFYRAYLADHDQLVGIQIRTFSDTPLPYISDQIQQCIRDHDLLPKVVTNTDSVKIHVADLRAPRKGISVLMTALQSNYYENLRDYYMSGPTEGDESVAIHQPSHEGFQQTDQMGHNLKAWAEIYLLSLSDTLITSGWSTFGYSAQALAGIKPWILPRSMDGLVPDPPCVYAKSMEPCLHAPPPLKCNLQDSANPAKTLPYVQACEDMTWGIKLITEPSSAVQNSL